MRHVNYKKRYCHLAVFALIVSLSCSFAEAQLFTIPWHSIDGGGGKSARGVFEIEGTIGQHDAGERMYGGVFELNGGFWGSTQDNTVVLPTTIVVTRGTLSSGGIPQLLESDNTDVAIRRANNDFQAKTQFVVSAVSPYADPGLIEVILEGAVFARRPITQTIELYNFDFAEWEVVDVRQASRLTDATVVAEPGGDLVRFVEPGSLRIEARVSFDSAVQRAVFSSNTDYFAWRITQ